MWIAIGTWSARMTETRLSDAIARNGELNHMIISIRASLPGKSRSHTVQNFDKKKKKKKKEEEKRKEQEKGRKEGSFENWFSNDTLENGTMVETCPLILASRNADAGSHHAPAILFLLRSSGPQSRHELFRTVASFYKSYTLRVNIACTSCFVVKESTFRSNSDRRTSGNIIDVTLSNARELVADIPYACATISRDLRKELRGVSARSRLRWLLDLPLTDTERERRWERILH